MHKGIIIPAKAGIQTRASRGRAPLDSGFRRNGELKGDYPNKAKVSSYDRL
jgi:hypothetical protein